MFRWWVHAPAGGISFCFYALTATGSSVMKHVPADRHGARVALGLDVGAPCAMLGDAQLCDAASVFSREESEERAAEFVLALSARGSEGLYEMLEQTWRAAFE
jgi:hypothetical protein